ncbi:hypothetical protein G4B88_008152 [Cannabis sativa]|uniref:Reverse transcriptase zinc-binding domain-containing protein n=1 Tax=Cannabis sativa TaxID=3483 RepID=A0A7J6I861_CANSA|nr:hypothetical protein G4B88_008152 [Cannabis sativa]
MLLQKYWTWNVCRVTQWFASEDARNILNIGLPASKQDDSWRWLGENTGLFSIKFAYHLITNQRCAGSPLGTWKLIWNSPIHVRLKLLWWQIMSNALPTHERIALAFNLPSILCPICDRERELSFHLFWSCDYASALWFGCCWGIRTNASNCGKWEKWMDWFGSNRNRPATLSFDDFMTGALCIFEVIWKVRNEVTHGGQLLQISMAMRNASTRLNDHLACKADRPCKVPTVPLPGWMTCCTDVTIDSNYSFGAEVFRDSKNRICSVVADRFSVTDPTLAEASILLSAARHAAHLNFNSVNFFCDNDSAVSSIREAHGIQSNLNLDGVSTHFKTLSAQFVNWNVKKINRNENFMAHNAAKWAKLNSTFGDIQITSMDPKVFEDYKEWWPDPG